MSAEFITPNATSVSENIPVNTVVLAIKAIDKDEGRNSYLEYSLYDPSKTFTVGPVDGLLKVVGRLDRETRANYSLEVTAKDRGDPPRSSKQTILINVLDENDNSPMFDPKHYSASIAENASIGTSVLQVGISWSVTSVVKMSFPVNDGPLLMWQNMTFRYQLRMWTKVPMVVSGTLFSWEMKTEILVYQKIRVSYVWQKI